MCAWGGEGASTVSRQLLANPQLSGSSLETESGAHGGASWLFPWFCAGCPKPGAADHAVISFLCGRSLPAELVFLCFILFGFGLYSHKFLRALSSWASCFSSPTVMMSLREGQSGALSGTLRAAGRTPGCGGGGVIIASWLPSLPPL